MAQYNRAGSLILLAYIKTSRSHKPTHKTVSLQVEPNLSLKCYMTPRTPSKIRAKKISVIKETQMLRTFRTICGILVVSLSITMRVLMITIIIYLLLAVLTDQIAIVKKIDRVSLGLIINNRIVDVPSCKVNKTLWITIPVKQKKRWKDLRYQIQKIMRLIHST